MDEILIKYLLGETSTEEKQKVQLWLEQSDDNRKHFEEFKFIWNESKKIEVASDIDETAAWKNFESLLQKRGFQSHVNNPDRFASGGRRIFLRMAAAAMLILTAGLLGYFYFHPSETIITAGKEVLIKTLPDHSVVTLNKNATLSYNKTFNEKSRKVKLEGEAFFNVAANKQKPFEIEVNDVKVRVVGTSFNIKSNQSGTEIIVETGVVTVSVKDKSVKLLPHQKIMVSKNSYQLIVQANHDELYNYYRTDEFICNNTPLYQLVEALNKNYDVNIKISNAAAAQLRLTTQFEKENLSDILKVISETLNLKIEHNKSGQIIIK